MNKYTAGYHPDHWVVIKIPSTGLYKVLAGWDDSSWRINSGINLVVDHDDEVHFYGYSGSLYVCNKDKFGVTPATHSVYDQIKHVVKLMDADTNWNNLL